MKVEITKLASLRLQHHFVLELFIFYVFNISRYYVDFYADEILKFSQFIFMIFEFH